MGFGPAEDLVGRQKAKIVEYWITGRGKGRGAMRNLLPWAKEDEGKGVDIKDEDEEEDEEVDEDKEIEWIWGSPKEFNGF